MKWFSALLVSSSAVVVTGALFSQRATTSLGTVQFYASISQGYLGFFALAFTILFIAIQLSPYSDIDLAGAIFDSVSISYLVLLFLVIFVPLLVMAFDIFMPMLQFISLGLAIIAFVLFPFFFLNLRMKLRPSSVMTMIIQAISKDVLHKDLDKLAEHVDFLFRITTKAFTLSDYVTVQHALKCFCIVFNKIQAFPGEDSERPATKYLLQRMSDLRRIFLRDPYAVKLILIALADMGKQAIRRGLPNADIGRIMEIIEVIPWQAINTGNSLALQEAVRTYDELLDFMSSTIYNYDYQSKLSKWYVLIGAYGHQNSDEYSQRIVSTSLRNHIACNRIDFGIACQQALLSVQSNAYWELKHESVVEFVHIWTQTPDANCGGITGT